MENNEDTNIEKKTKTTIYSDKNIAIILSSIAVLAFFYDILISDVKTCLNNTTNNKKKLLIILITFVHHFIAVYGLLGWLFNNKFLLITYIVLMIGTIVQWKFTGGECLITKSVSILSDNPNYKRFNDIYRIIGLKKLIPSRILYYGSLSIFMGIALYKIVYH